MSDKTVEQRKGKELLSKAIDDLAALFQYGALQSCTDPTGLLEDAAEEITTLRAKCDRLKRTFRKFAAAHDNPAEMAFAECCINEAEEGKK